MEPVIILPTGVSIICVIYVIRKILVKRKKQADMIGINQKIWSFNIFGKTIIVGNNDSKSDHSMTQMYTFYEKIDKLIEDIENLEHSSHQIDISSQLETKTKMLLYRLHEKKLRRNADLGIGIYEYEYGEWLTSNHRKPAGLEYFKKAAENGHSQAQQKLSLYHARKGEYDKAFEWELKAAEQFDESAMGYLDDLAFKTKKSENIKTAFCFHELCKYINPDQYEMEEEYHSLLGKRCRPKWGLLSLVDNRKKCQEYLESKDLLEEAKKESEELIKKFNDQKNAMNAIEKL